ncbi:hypothetical protein SAMN04488109_1355 [Chryseolinea serpens]|uniref:Uncharacterized protein n=1 Tax=Chryseolinea serpens TaxID=947013 RepID=A0A1M5LRI3_9BACT|nr:hypothetical protein [Chryseolinea serpens]SHG67586.1 hypothetical protein SAMN04488109_1355 [Chryseolinea serpens]
MKKYFLLMLMVSRLGYGQMTEFKTYANGLIYSESTMQRLGTIVDSLNLKFKSCDLSRPYYSLYQGPGHFVNVPSKEARNLIKEGIGLDDYVEKFDKETDSTNIWIVKIPFTNYNDEKMIQYIGLPSGRHGSPSVTVVYSKASDVNSGWVLSKLGSRALFIEKLTHYELPQPYARLVQYVDCMIDTTAEIFLPKAKSEFYQMVETGSKADQYVQWARKFPGAPTYPDYDKLKGDARDSAMSIFDDKYHKWDSLRLIHVDQHMAKKTYWSTLLADATQEALTTGNTDEEFEFYVSRYGPPKDALQLKRSRIVVGRCSMDQRPRDHAMNICSLAAETAQWDIFLRSHLDIMNDRFERMSDGSYAWGQRKTYLRELEKLDIPAVDLLLGTTLRVQNVSDNHYQSSIGRAGRALSDAEDKDALETQLTDMICNASLDPYNRLLTAYLFSNYAYNLSDNVRRDTSLEKLNHAVRTLPEDARRVWSKK